MVEDEEVESPVRDEIPFPDRGKGVVEDSPAKFPPFTFMPSPDSQLSCPSSVGSSVYTSTHHITIMVPDGANLLDHAEGSMPLLKELIGPLEKGSLDNQSGIDLVDDLLHYTLRVQFFVF